MLSRRRVLALFAAGAISTPVLAASDIFQDLLRGLTDKNERAYFERHRNEARWDGKYYYDNVDGKRYTRDEWQKELRWRYQEEKAGRDWQKQRGRKSPKKAEKPKPQPPKKDKRDERKEPPRH